MSRSDKLSAQLINQFPLFDMGNLQVINNFLALVNFSSEPLDFVLELVDLTFGLDGFGAGFLEELVTRGDAFD